MSNQSGSPVKPRFALGSVVATPGALAALERCGADALTLLSRHQSGDWGEVSAEDGRENEFSVENQFRILSSYRVGADTRIWIITEADRSVTTLLLPDEY